MNIKTRSKKKFTYNSNGFGTKAVIYARVSSKEQESGYSIDAQLSLLRDYAMKMGFQVTSEYVEAESAKSSGRAQFGKMRDFLQNEIKKASGTKIILVEKIDRLYRNFRDNISLDVDDMPIQIHFVKENSVLDSTTSASHKFLHSMKVTLAKQFIDNLKEEVSKGMMQKAKSGWYPSMARIGYKNISDGKRKIIVPDPESAPLIRKLFEKYSQGKYSLDDIVRYAIEINLKSKNGNDLHRSQIQDILRNIIYTGKYFNYGGVRYPANHEAIIPFELWERVQGTLDAKKTYSPKKGDKVFGFSGLMRCGQCGSFFVGEQKKGKYTYYHCTHSRGPCNVKSWIKEEVVIDQITDLLKQLELDEELVSWLSKAVADSREEQERFQQEELKSLQDRYSKLQSLQTSLLNKFVEDLIGKEAYEMKRAEFSKESTEILGKMSRLESAVQVNGDLITTLAKFTKKAHVLWLKQQSSARRDLLMVIVQNCTVKEGRVVLELRQPFEFIRVTNLAMRQAKDLNQLEEGVCKEWYTRQESNL
jgi:site-specific DNA recombinase